MNKSEKILSIIDGLLLRLESQNVQLTIDEMKYVEELKACMVSGTLSMIDKYLMKRIALCLGISERRRLVIEMYINKK